MIDKSFRGTSSRLGGASLTILAREAIARHTLAFHSIADAKMMPNPGLLHWRAGGELHMNSPEVIANLQSAARERNAKAYDAFSSAANQAAQECTLRGQLEFCEGQKVPLDEVEPAKEIVKRFCTGERSTDYLEFHGGASGDSQREVYFGVEIRISRNQGFCDETEPQETKIDVYLITAKRAARVNVIQQSYGATRAKRSDVINKVTRHYITVSKRIFIRI